MQAHQIIKSVIAKLEYIRDVPVDELETGQAEVQLKMVDLRDRLIDQLRKDESNQAARKLLHQINIALSLIFGLGYPITGFQRNKIEQTIEALKPLAGTAV